MDKIKVSVIVTVYNVEAYVERCLASIQNQTIQNIEIIVVDDCTPDNSMDIVSRIAAVDERIKIIKHKENLGLMKARQTGYKNAEGDYVAFCDSDDYLPKNAIELLYNAAIETEADIVSGNLQYIKVDGTNEVWSSSLVYGNDKKSAFKSLLHGELKHNLCSKLFKRSLLQNFDYKTYEHFTNGEDGCLFYQLISNTNKIVQIEDCVYYYMQNTSSSSQVRYRDEALRCICITNKIRHEVTCMYSELNAIRHQCITQIFYNLYLQGYAYSSHFNELIAEQGLQEYKTLSLKYFSITEIVKLLIKRFVMGPMNYIKMI